MPSYGPSSARSNALLTSSLEPGPPEARAPLAVVHALSARGSWRARLRRERQGFDDGDHRPATACGERGDRHQLRLLHEARRRGGGARLSHELRHAGRSRPGRRAPAHRREALSRRAFWRVRAVLRRARTRLDGQGEHEALPATRLRHADRPGALRDRACRARSVLGAGRGRRGPVEGDRAHSAEPDLAERSNRRSSIAVQRSHTTRIPAASARWAAATLPSASWNHIALMPAAIASSTTLSKYSPRRKTSTKPTFSSLGMSTSRSYERSPSTVSPRSAGFTGMTR